ncbi:hypothetical protein SK128_015552 [Halocaridina rubra]|uniref:Uncharacterized protein n=1 Tax=Halocaridina rubra TaxID=373956 RepID=A0AAN8WW90_HALRR
MSPVISQIVENIVSICEGCNEEGDDSDIASYPWPDLAQIFQDNQPSMVMDDSVSSLTEHIRMLSNILPYERQYFNYSYVEDIEDEIECPEDKQPATTTTTDVSTTFSSTTEVSISTASTTPSSSVFSTVTLSTSTETSRLVNTTSATTSSPTTYLSSEPTSETQTTAIMETTSEESSEEILTEYSTKIAPETTTKPSSLPTIPLLQEDKEDELIEVDQGIEIGCEDGEDQNSNQVL